MKSAEAVERFPLGAGIKLAELERYDNAPLLQRLREREPVTWFAEQGVWLVTSKALFDELQMDPERFVVDVPDNPQHVVLGRQMLVVDGEEHARHRGPFAEPFKYSAVRRQFTDVVAGRVESLLSAMEAGGAGSGAGAAELGAAFANPFAVGVASDVLGLGLEEIEEVHHIYTTFAEGMVGYRDPEAVARAAQGRARLDELLVPRIERLALEPDDSMLAAVAAGGAPGWRTPEELLANLRLILFGAIETVESMILNTTWALLLHPEQVRALSADPDLWPGAVQEGLRWVPPVGYTDRWASVDTELGGVSDRSRRLPDRGNPCRQPRSGHVPGSGPLRHHARRPAPEFLVREGHPHVPGGQSRAAPGRDCAARPVRAPAGPAAGPGASVGAGGVQLPPAASPARPLGSVSGRVASPHHLDRAWIHYA